MASRRGFSPIIGGVNGHPANQGLGRSYGIPSVFDTNGYEYKWDDKLGDYVCWISMDGQAIPFYYKNVVSGTSKGPGGFPGVSHSSQLPESPDESFKKFLDTIPPEWIKLSKVGQDKKLENMGCLFNFKLVDSVRSPVYQNGIVSKDVYATTGYRIGNAYVIFDLSRYKFHPIRLQSIAGQLKKKLKSEGFSQSAPLGLPLTHIAFEMRSLGKKETEEKLARLGYRAPLYLNAFDYDDSDWGYQVREYKVPPPQQSTYLSSDSGSRFEVKKGHKGVERKINTEVNHRSLPLGQYDPTEQDGYMELEEDDFAPPQFSQKRDVAKKAKTKNSSKKLTKLNKKTTSLSRGVYDPTTEDAHNEELND